MSSLIIRGGRVIDPASGFDAVADVLIRDGRIEAIGETGADAEQVIDAAGKIVCPGLVDLAARVREPGQTHKADIASESRAAAAGGITTLCCPPDTDPVVETSAVVDLIRRKAEQAGGARLLPYGALTQGLQGLQLTRMVGLREAGCVAMSDGGRPVVNSLVLRRALEYAGSFGLPVMLTPRDPWLSEGGVMHEGPMATRQGLAGIPEAAETAELGRDLALVEQTGARVHFGRLSTARGAELIARARRDGLPVSADVAIHQLFLTDMDASDFSPAGRTDPPLRSQLDREALRQAVASGTIAAICSDHQPHDRDAKIGPFGSVEPGLSGVDSLLALTLRLVDDRVLPLADALATLTCNPADILGIDAGRLQPGAIADVCVFDPRAVWWLRPETLRSRGKNSAFLGWEFTGRVTHTVLAGRLIYTLAEA